MNQPGARDVAPRGRRTTCASTAPTPPPDGGGRGQSGAHTATATGIRSYFIYFIYSNNGFLSLSCVMLVKDALRSPLSRNLDKAEVSGAWSGPATPRSALNTLYTPHCIGSRTLQNIIMAEQGQVRVQTREEWAAEMKNLQQTTWPRKRYDKN